MFIKVECLRSSVVARNVSEKGSVLGEGRLNRVFTKPMICVRSDPAACNVMIGHVRERPAVDAGGYGKGLSGCHGASRRDIPCTPVAPIVSAWPSSTSQYGESTPVRIGKSWTACLSVR